jgi:hypothetical protein
MRKLFLLACMLSATVCCMSQQLPEEVSEDRIENIAAQSSSETDFTEIEEMKTQLKEHPIDLNYSTEEEMSAFGIFDPVQILEILQHRKLFGNFIALEEIQTLDYFDPQVMQRLLPYLRIGEPLVDEKLRPNALMNKGSSKIWIRSQRLLEDQQGYIKDENGLKKYDGSPWKLYSRYRYTAGNYFSFNVTAEKDAGESFFQGNHKSGFDFYSMHLFVVPNRTIKSFVIGDYQLQYGQGLIAWSGLAFGKGSETVLVKKQGMGIRPYSSAGEYGFYRGAAVHTVFRHMNVDAWISHQKVDASIKSDSLQGDLINAVQTDGYHRNDSEMEGKGNSTQTIAGANIGFKKNGWRVGYTAQWIQYSEPLYAGNDLYEIHDAQGNNFLNQGINYAGLIKNINVFGEVAVDEKMNKAMVNGLIAGVDKRISISVIHRRYEVGYHSVTANAFREGSQVTNENGTYVGLQFVIAKPYKLSLYSDMFSFPWLKYQVSAPSRGNDQFVQFTYTPSRTTEVYLRWHIAHKEQNNPEQLQGAEMLIPVNTQSYRFQVKFKSGTDWYFQSRVEYVKNQTIEITGGSVIYQDVIYKPLGKPYSFALRLGLFTTDSYDTRIYSYEQDIPGSYSISPMYGSGKRVYFMTRLRPYRGIDLWIRAGRSIYPGTTSIGSGNDAIANSHKTEIKLQLAVQL